MKLDGIGVWDEPHAVTVSDLNAHLKRILDARDEIQGIWVAGEVADFHLHVRSGHLYFSLADERSRISCVMFRSDAAGLDFAPRDGLRVLAFGDVGVYEKAGAYQLYTRLMVQAGDGSISRRFEQIRRKLADEGLFDSARKRPIPRYPRRIALVTSPEGAAVRDVLTVISRRYPCVEVVIVPCSVQGSQAVDSIVDALTLAAESGPFDLGILTRGGGAADDLWVFNEEAVARRLAEMPFPMICAVGHERDFTICDFVADLRAPTPSAAAEMGVPDRSELRLRIDELADRAERCVSTLVRQNAAALSRCLSSWVLRRPESLLRGPCQDLDQLVHSVEQAMELGTGLRRQRLDILLARLEAVNPARLLARGYAVVVSEANGDVIKDASTVSPGDLVGIRLSRGALRARVIAAEVD